MAREIKRSKQAVAKTSTSGLISALTCQHVHVQHIIRVMFKYVYGAGSLNTSKIYPPRPFLSCHRNCGFPFTFLPKMEMMKKLQMTSTDYDEDENEEYDDYQSSSWSSMYSYSTPVLESTCM